MTRLTTRIPARGWPPGATPQQRAPLPGALSEAGTPVARMPSCAQTWSARRFAGLSGTLSARFDTAGGAQRRPSQRGAAAPRCTCPGCPALGVAWGVLCPVCSAPWSGAAAGGTAGVRVAGTRGARGPEPFSGTIWMVWESPRAHPLDELKTTKICDDWVTALEGARVRRLRAVRSRSRGSSFWRSAARASPATTRTRNGPRSDWRPSPRTLSLLRRSPFPLGRVCLRETAFD